MWNIWKERLLAGEGVSPLGIRECAATIDGFARSWREYLPRGFDPAERLPLVVSIHGGDFHRAHLTTAWHLLAERERFVVLYPQSIRNGVTWNAWDKLDRSHGRPDEVRFLDSLLDLICERYNIDTTRIYLHGQSMGDMVATQYGFARPERLAAAALFSGPTKTKWFMEPDGTFTHRPTGPLPVMRLHGSLDNFQVGGCPEEELMLAKRVCHINPNNRLWREVNGCGVLPELCTHGERAVERYPGRDGAELIFYSLEGGAAPPAAGDCRGHLAQPVPALSPGGRADPVRRPHGGLAARPGRGWRL